MIIISLTCIKEKDDIPSHLLEKYALQFPQAHYDTEVMAMLAKEISLFNKDKFCNIPFCSTVEPEAFGAIINLGDNKSGPRTKGYKYKDVNELEQLKDIDFTRGRIKKVLDSVKLLNNEGRLVVLKVAGPITILSSLLEMKTLVKGFRKKERVLYKALETIERNIGIYTSIATKNGASIISYADPTGNIDLVGPKFYKEITAETNYNLLKHMANSQECPVVHLCKIQSRALEKLGLLEVKKIKCSGKLNYSEAMLELAQKDNVRLFGHRCLKNHSNKLVDYLYKINLTT